MRPVNTGGTQQACFESPDDGDGVLSKRTKRSRCVIVRRDCPQESKLGSEIRFNSTFLLTVTSDTAQSVSSKLAL